MNVKIEQTVVTTMPGSKAEQSFRVTRAHDGKLLFKSGRTIGIYDPRNKAAFYSSRGNSTTDLRYRARGIILPEEVVEAFDSVAVLSDKGKNALLGVK